MKDISFYKDKTYWHFKYGGFVIGTHNIDRIKTSIKELPNRIKRSDNLIYPERKMDFIKWMIKKIDVINESILDDSFTVMEGMEEGLDPIDAQNLINYRDELHKRLVSRYILYWYKNGYEYFMKTLPEGEQISKRELEEIEYIRILNTLCKGMTRKLKEV